MDPRTDSDISNIVSKYFESLSNPHMWKTWYQKRITDPSFPDDDKSSAIKTESHANTPSTTFFDSLGRSFLVLSHNGFNGEVSKTISYSP